MILKDPQEVLHTKCDPVSFKEGMRIGGQLKQEYQQAVKDAKDTIVVGLAAPQIGVPKRVFVIFGEVFINPLISTFASHLVPSKEGCLSLPEVYQPKRFMEITASWTDSARRLQHRKLEYREAIIFQHEFDHLNGKLCNMLD